MSRSIGSIALKVGSGSKQQVQKENDVDIITFVEASWGLNRTLFPVQRVILKAYYSIPLDDNPYNFDLSKPVPLNHPDYNNLVHMTDNPLDDENGYYKYRVVISDWRRQKWEYLSEAGYLRKLYKEGRCNIEKVDPNDVRTELILPIGRRSGKTEISAFIAAYETYKLLRKQNPHAYYGMPYSTKINLVSVATAKEQAAELFNRVSVFFKDCAYFIPYKANDTTSFINFQTDEIIRKYGRWVDNEKSPSSISVRFVPSRAKGLRGKSYSLVIFDEIAHFQEKGQSGADELYSAIVPATLTYTPKDPNNKTKPIGPNEGRVIHISSPLGKSGLFYNLFRKAMEGTANSSRKMLAIQAPTWEVNPTLTADDLETFYSKNRDTFFVEFGAQFGSNLLKWIEQPEDLLNCIDKKLRPVLKGHPSISYFVGLDFGLVNDGTAIAIGHIDDNQNIILDYLDALYAGQGKYADKQRLESEEVINWIFNLSKKYNFSSGLFDQWAGIVIQDLLNAKGLNMLKSENFTGPLSSAIYKNFKDLMWEKRIKLYDSPIPEGKEHCNYIDELLTLECQIKSKYIVEVEAPKVPGAHDDCSDALVRMIYEASRNFNTNKSLLNKKGIYGSGLINPATTKRLDNFMKMRRGYAPNLGR